MAIMLKRQRYAKGAKVMPDTPPEPAPTVTGEMFSPEAIERANAHVERVSRELDITNADHIALWLEANIHDSTLGWLACRIIEAHEQQVALATLTQPTPSLQPDLSSNEGQVDPWVSDVFERSKRAALTTPKPIREGKMSHVPSQSPSNEGQGDVVVTQADRDAAADCVLALELHNMNENIWANICTIREGRGDHFTITQAFAAHRLSSLRQQAAEVEALREELAQLKGAAHLYEVATRGLTDRATKLEADLEKWKGLAGDYAIGLEEIRDASWVGNDPVAQIRRTADYWLRQAREAQGA